MKQGPALAAMFATLPLAGIAQTPMTGDEFDAYVTGNTITYGRDGSVHATAEFLPGRKYRFAFGDYPCVEGYWYEAGNQICTVDEEQLFPSDGTPECFLFFTDREGLRGRYMGDGGSDSDMIEIGKIDGPLSCSAAGV